MYQPWQAEFVLRAGYLLTQCNCHISSWFLLRSVQFSKGTPSLGLSHVVKRLLGKPLDKSMQVSDWEMRPLSPWQIQYAAQDAHVLLSLYKYLVANDKGATFCGSSILAPEIWK